MDESIQQGEVSAPEETQPQKGGIRWTTVAIVAVVLGILGLLGWGLINTNAARPEVGQPAPDVVIEL